jgi:hypothetical protein
MPYAFGALVPITGEVRSAAGVLTNATTVSLEILLPDGTIATPTVANPPAVTGVYTYDYLPTIEDGPYKWYLSTTGPNSALSGSFYVLAKFPTYVISLDEAKAQQNIDSSADDDELMPFIAATTSVIERHTGRTITRQTVTGELHPGLCSDVFYLHRRPVLSRGQWAIYTSPAHQVGCSRCLDGSTATCWLTMCRGWPRSRRISRWPRGSSCSTCGRPNGVPRAARGSAACRTRWA